MVMKKKCKYCNLYYDINLPHECRAKEIKSKQNYIKKQEQYLEANKDTDAYKLLHSTKWVKFRREIIDLDGGFCQRCLIKFNTYTYDNLEVHHIKPRNEYPELIFDQDNVVTLCKECNVALGLNGIDFDWKPEDRKDIRHYIL